MQGVEGIKGRFFKLAIAILMTLIDALLLREYGDSIKYLYNFCIVIMLL